MTDRIHPTLTATEFERRYAGRPYELIEGKVVKVSPVRSLHGEIVVELAFLIKLFLYVHKIKGMLHTEVGYVLSDQTIVGPDLGYITPERAKGVAPDRFVTVTPDLVVEVISPSERKAGIERKLALYQTAQIPLIWLIFTRRPRAVVYTFDPVAVGYAQPVTIPFEGMLDGGSVLPGFGAAVSALFPPTENVEGGSS